MAMERNNSARLDDEPAQATIATIDADLLTQINRADNRVGNALGLSGAIGVRIIPLATGWTFASHNGVGDSGKGD